MRRFPPGPKKESPAEAGQVHPGRKDEAYQHQQQIAAVLRLKRVSVAKKSPASVSGAPGVGVSGGDSHSIRASVQVTALGAVTRVIVAVSTKPNRQNRSTCSRMSVPLVQKQKLRLVNRINWRARRSHLPRHDRYDGQRHRDGKYEPSWF